MQTKAIVFPELNRAALESIELPALQDTDALVDVELSGVSVGTEVWALTGQRPPGDTTFPCVPGYQAVGVVREVGSSAALKPGERIFFTRSRLPPPHAQGNWMGSHLATAVVDASEHPKHGYWVRLPEGVTPEDAALSALASVSERGLQHVGVHSNELCVVIGQGVIGQAAAQIARIRGAEVLAVDIVPKRLEMAARTGADSICNPQETDLAQEVHRRKHAGADLVIEATGNKTLIPQAIALVRPLGRVLLQGWYPGEIAFPFHQAHLHRPTIAITCGMDYEGNKRALQWLSERRLLLAPLITHTFRPEEASEAYEMMRTRPSEFLGVTFNWRP